MVITLNAYLRISSGLTVIDFFDGFRSQQVHASSAILFPMIPRRTLRKLAALAAIAVAAAASPVQAFVPVFSDHIGSIRALVDATSGETVAEYEYDPYGVLPGVKHSRVSCERTGGAQSLAPAFGGKGLPPSKSLFRFNGKYYDPETQLLYFGYRYYSPADTKWLTVDPLQERGGLNFTACCGGDPVNQVDPMGLYWQRNANGNWAWVSGSSSILEDMVSPGIDTAAAAVQAVPDIWSGVWEGLQNTRIPESQGNGFVSTAWNGVASAGNAILAPLATAAEPRPQDYDDGLLMFGEACFGSGRGFGDRF